MKNLREIFHKGGLPLIAILGLVFALFTIIARPSAKKEEPLINPPQMSFTRNIAGIGIIEPQSELINLGIELSGVVRSIFIKVGDEVKKDDPLFALDERDINAHIEILVKSLAVANIQAEEAAAQFDIVDNIPDKRAIAKDEFNRRQYAKQLALAKVAELEAELERAKTTKDRLTLKAPIDGKILELNARLGEYANAGILANPIVLMGDTSTLNVRVEIDEENAPNVKAESSAFGLKRGDTAAKIPLKFVRFEPYIHPKKNLGGGGERVDTRVLQVIYALPPGIENVFVGQQMDVFINYENTAQS